MLKLLVNHSRPLGFDVWPNSNVVQLKCCCTFRYQLPHWLDHMMSACWALTFKLQLTCSLHYHFHLMAEPLLKSWMTHEAADVLLMAIVCEYVHSGLSVTVFWWKPQGNSCMKSSWPHVQLGTHVFRLQHVQWGSAFRFFASLPLSSYPCCRCEQLRNITVHTCSYACVSKASRPRVFILLLRHFR